MREKSPSIASPEANLENNPTDYFDPNEDRIREECGVFGIFGIDNAASLTALGMHALQHRGQEACGIASFDGEKFHTERHLGLVGDNFTGADPSERLKGHAAIGHVRYSCLLYTSPSPRDRG